ncbi:MAG: radical SAM family heme chaperone HemW [Desulfobacterium sp.]|nr:radical SAM family heme chaperone HemW [Desulfobacterium sp.]MBU3949402.1 radical SAM family heme chaperone HemW [Pseudomonadota bacterium]MBU4037254.1 radical SAM family heme chaperone HemW [Pseudomonadota bacterium]
MTIAIEPNPAGIYIHIPFCVNKCPYCDFYSITDHSLKKEFVKALLLEMSLYKSVPPVSDTIYIGGGTPSVLKSKDIGQIIETVFNLFKITPDPEITIEVNPKTISPGSLKGFKQTGINRINIGVQSFSDDNLKFLGRIHSSIEAKEAISWAKNAGFENLGIDLIYGIPGQTEKSWLLDLKTAMQFEPDHISCYTLTYEPKTPIYNHMKSGFFSPMPDYLAGSLFELTSDFLENCGYIHYEISNFSRSIDKKSRHNTKYWSDVPYIGFGPSAHSFDGRQRSWNVRSVKDYIKNIESGLLATEEKEVLSKEQHIIEAILLGLRKKEGINISNFNMKFEINFKEVFKETISDLREKKLIILINEQCRLTKKGTLLLDSICAMFALNEF